MALTLQTYFIAKSNTMTSTVNDSQYTPDISRNSCGADQGSWESELHSMSVIGPIMWSLNIFRLAIFLASLRRMFQRGLLSKTKRARIKEPIFEYENSMLMIAFQFIAPRPAIIRPTDICNSRCKM